MPLLFLSFWEFSSNVYRIEMDSFYPQELLTYSRIQFTLNKKLLITSEKKLAKSTLT